MKTFLGDDFILSTDTARELYEYARKMPIFDYHCHNPPAQIAENTQFENVTQPWLYGDHYKWRALRTLGVPEDRITGSASDRDKFQAWAETVPRTIGNPLFQWTHLELNRYFGVDELLNPQSAERIWNQCNELLAKPGYRVQGLVEMMNVKVLCTTDDPVDDLAHHRKIREDGTCPFEVFPAFRPDKAHAVDNHEIFNPWVDRLEQAAGMSVKSFGDLIAAVKKRHDYFHSMGGRLSDHALLYPVADDFTDREIEELFRKVRGGTSLTGSEVTKFKSAVMLELGRMDAEAGWTMQLHIGALRSTNTRMYKRLGPDTGYDSMADFPIAYPLARFLDRLDAADQLPKMILYSVNPNDNEVLATMIGNFQDPRIPGKMQFGTAWWFNDQRDGMEQQMIALANMGLLAPFVGMLTDSRSFLSYPRHEYFRRILCNLIGNWVASGEVPNDMSLLRPLVEDICYNNAVRYFDLPLKG